MDQTVERVRREFTSAVEFWRAMVEHSSFGMAIAPVGGSFTILNPAFSQMLGLASDELQHTPVSELFGFTVTILNLGLLDRVGEENTQSMKCELCHERRDGTSIWLGVSVWLASETASLPRSFVMTLEDITERKSTELALRRRQADLEREVETGRQGFVALDAGTDAPSAPIVPVAAPPGFGETTHYVEDKAGREDVPNEIVGAVTGLRGVFDNVRTVAGSDATVILLGETGTGKELIARAIHNLSPRRFRPFVRADCVSMPEALVENELFGHEKGAFTGATSREAGRFEAVEDGTLFLDEVGDIAAGLQSKLLRVLQEREFERLGSTRTIRANFRLIAATNRDLAHMVEQNHFRSDLFYRLNVFPISLPPLRDRKEDIPLLTWYFVRKYARKVNKRIVQIRREDMDSLVDYAWPGNVRELQNVVERAVILTPNTVLHIFPFEKKHARAETASASKTLEQVEREHILQTLHKTDWVIGGPYGAAAKLGMRRTTLLYKMRRLGISRPET